MIPFDRWIPTPESRYKLNVYILQDSEKLLSLFLLRLLCALLQNLIEYSYFKCKLCYYKMHMDIQNI